MGRVVSLFAVTAVLAANSCGAGSTGSPAPSPTDVASGWDVAHEDPGTEALLHDVWSGAGGAAWAVGYEITDRSDDGVRWRGYVLRREGRRWERVAVPTPDDVMIVEGVHGTGANDVWVVGWTRPGPEGAMAPLALHWGGDGWDETSVPIGAAGGELRAVAASGPADVWSVGSASVAGSQAWRPVSFHWDGGRWRDEPFPPVDGCADVRLDDVAAAGTTVLAIGTCAGDTGHVGFVASWTAAGWVVDEMFGSGPHSTMLSAVSVAGDEAWIVGRRTGPGVVGADRMVVLRRDGSEWVDVPVPFDVREAGGLDAVATADGDTWVVGAAYQPGHAIDDPGVSTALSYRWDGEEWHEAPVSGVAQSTLTGVAVDDDGGVWAVGTASDDGWHPSPLVLRR